MRLLVPLALFGATTVLAADSFEAFFDPYVPSCMKECTVKAYESASGCGSGSFSSTDSSDISCLCKELIGGSALSDAVSSMSDCATKAVSKCSKSELEAIGSFDLNEMGKEARSLCSNADSSSSSSNSPSNDDSGDSSSSSSSSNGSSNDDNSDETDDSNNSDNKPTDGAAALAGGSTAILAAGVMMLVAAL